MAELDQLNASHKKVQSGLKRVNEELTNLNRQIKELTAVPIVTEHAVLRYIERVLGVDLKEIEAYILTDDIRDALNNSASGKFSIGEGAWVLAENRVIRTVVVD